MSKNRAAFFDRDGTLIHHVHYLNKLEQVKVLLPAVTLCKILKDKGFKLFVVTNQSGVARGQFDETFVERTHALVTELFMAYDVHFEKFYVCPHHPIASGNLLYKKVCECRKPRPGMLFQAAQEFDIDLTKSLMFGDSSTDLEAGRLAGCASFDIAAFLSLSHDECAKLLKDV